MGERPRNQPFQQLIAILRLQDSVQGIRLLVAPYAVRHGQKMQIVVAQHYNSVGAECAHESQHLERSRAAVDQVAAKVDPVAVRGEAELAEELLQLVVTPLNIADRIACHWRIPGMASRKAAIGDVQG